MVEHRTHGPSARLLRDGRLHLQHGPIDLIIEAFGDRAEVTLAYRQAWLRFQDVLATLVGELPLLRRAVDGDHPGVAGPVARRIGWRGRSFSRGIADAATILARDGAAADAAATLIGNAVDLDHPAIERTKACDLDEASDLGERLVTTNVGRLAPAEVGQALGNGIACAEAMRRAGLIHGAVLVLQRQFRVVGDVAPRLLSAA